MEVDEIGRISQEIAKGRITGGFVLLMIQKSYICEIDR